jgi:hypothetical protein
MVVMMLTSCEQDVFEVWEYTCLSLSLSLLLCLVFSLRGHLPPPNLPCNFESWKPSVLTWNSLMMAFSKSYKGTIRG